jgi:23S rRNA-/tRNA-specific pseudouridylate synthase
MDFPEEEPTEPEIVYEDDWLVAVRKPVRMHSAPGFGQGELCAWVFERYPEAGTVVAPAAGSGGDPSAGLPVSRRAGSPRSEGGLLHRLDYETSGLVLFARSGEAFASLLEQQARGAFHKEYTALSSPSASDEPKGSRPARGLPEGVEGGAWAEAREALDAGALSALLAASIERGRGGEGCGLVSAFRPYGPKGARVACLGRVASTEAAAVYRSGILAAAVRPRRSAGEEPIELRLGLARGFRHQLRAQLAWIGLPILGDPLYGGAPDSRLRLYAVKLSFAHPVSGNAFSIELDR